MSLLLLLFLPLLIGLGGFIFEQIWGKGRVTWKELLIHCGAVILVVGIGYGISMWRNTRDVEHWNGVIANKWKDNSGCCHAYPCNCRSVSCGKDCETTICDTCYLHPYDVYWKAETSNDEEAYSNSCNGPLTSEPARWTAIKIGEPTSIEHGFTNYIKGNPDTILRRQGAMEKWHDFLPDYPEVYDFYRANKFLAIGVKLPDQAKLNLKLAELNARLGKLKEVNVIVIVTSAGDQNYAEGLREAWLGGKKNDLLVVIGAPGFPYIEWVSVISWSKSEEMKIEIRDRILALAPPGQSLGAFPGEKILGVIESRAAAKFVRRPWEDFNYLRASLEPSTTAMIIIFVIGILLAIGLQIFLFLNDVFGEEGNGRPPINVRLPDGMPLWNIYRPRRKP